MLANGAGVLDIQRRFYDRTYAPGASRAASWLSRLIQRYELHRTDAVGRLLPRGGAWLDIGCGDGHLLAKCAQQFDRTLGVDLVFEQLRIAAKTASSAGLRNTGFAAVNVDTGLPLRNSTVDVVSAIAVIGFIFDPIALLEEIHRVLKPGGRLILEVLNLAYLPRRLALLCGHYPRHTSAPGWDGGHLHNFTRGALAAALVAHGFEPDVWTGSGVLAELRSWWPSLLTGNLIVSCRRL